MSRYIKYIIWTPFTLIKFVLIKLFNIKGFKFHPFELFSINSEIFIGKGAEVRLGKWVRAQSGTKIRVRKGGKLFVGENTSFNNGCIVTCHYNVNIGKCVEFGQNVLIYDHDHDFRTEGGINAKKFKYGSVEIGDNCWIGANTVILRNTKIGKNCVIGAGSVIRGQYPDNSIIIQKRETSVVSY